MLMLLPARSGGDVEPRIGYVEPSLEGVSR